MGACVRTRRPRRRLPGTAWRRRLEATAELSPTKVPRSELPEPRFPRARGTPWRVQCNSKYDGEWKDGECHGHGVEVSADGSIAHVGEWKDGKPHGQGFMTYLDGTYNGKWKSLQ